MKYSNTEKLLETVQTFVATMDKVQNASNHTSLAGLERKAVNALQLAQVEVEMAGRDLYEAVQARRKQINRGL